MSVLSESCQVSHTAWKGLYYAESSTSSFETPMSLDSSLSCHANSSDVGIVVENEELHLSSLLTLFDKLGCLQEHEEQYVSRESLECSFTYECFVDTCRPPHAGSLGVVHELRIICWKP